mgnify:FL=1
MEGNLFLIDSVYSVLEKVDAVIHLAAQMDFYPKDAASLYEVCITEMNMKHILHIYTPQNLRNYRME